ncbi:MAG: methyltransferase domain-containing protein [Bacteroidales bacterium]|nr:methyltransferase domain-containing protein [Bacteroidales bacterium]
MDVDKFMYLFLTELKKNVGLHSYYKPANGSKTFLFRKAYIEQRLWYIRDHMPGSPCKIWDVGCGFATTGIFLALNGYHVYGNTLEHYYDQIEKRLAYWSRFGDLSALTIRHEDLYDSQEMPDTYDVILLQDTLHHLEPVEEAVRIFHRVLKPGGKLMVIEENGSSIFIIMKNYLKRGCRTTLRYYDERLGKTVNMGNENAKGIPVWLDIFQKAGFTISDGEVEYIRLFPPFMFSTNHYEERIHQERELIRKNRRIMSHLCFGVNFSLNKPH